jgi:hypothetical protein
MSLSDAFIGELQQEATVTRKCLERIPETAFNWKPHEKSMSMVRLATHVAEMFQWVTETIKKPEMDFATADYKPFESQTTAQLVEYFDKNLSDANEILKPLRTAFSLFASE